MFGYDHPKLMQLRKLVDAERKAISIGWRCRWRRLRATTRPSSFTRPAPPAIPRARSSTHGKHLAAWTRSSTHYPTLRNKPHRTVAYLPLCHVLGRDVAITLPLISQLVPHFGEDPGGSARLTLFEIAPTVLFTVPRYLQKFAAQVAGRYRSIPVGSEARRQLRIRHAPCAPPCRNWRWDGTATVLDDAVYRACPGGRLSRRSSTSSASTGWSW